jgi:hypothetical protein
MQALGDQSTMDQMRAEFARLIGDDDKKSNRITKFFKPTASVTSRRTSASKLGVSTEVEREVAAALFVVKNGLASSMPNDISFKFMLEHSGYSAPNRDVIEDTMRDLYVAWKEYLRASVASGENVISVACDHWSHDGRSAVGVVVTHVDADWRRETDVIGLVPTGEERLTAETLTAVTQAALDFVFDDDVVIAFGTTDNNTTALKSMKEMLGDEDGIHCVLHLLDLATCDVTGKKLKHKTNEQRERAIALKVASNKALAADGVANLRVYSEKIATVYTVVSKRLRAVQALEEMQLESNVPRDRLVTLKYEAATRWQSGLRMWRAFLALRPYLVELKRSKARVTDNETLLPSDLDVLTEEQAADIVDVVHVFEVVEVVVKVLQGEQGNVAAVAPKTLQSLYDKLTAIGSTSRIIAKSIGSGAAEVAAALAVAVRVRMSHLWLTANYLHGAALLDISTTTDVPESMLDDVLNIITRVSFQIADEDFSLAQIDAAEQSRRNDLHKLVAEMRAFRENFIEVAAGSRDIGLAFWREVESGNVKFSTTARTAHAWFSRTIRAFMTISPSEAAAERAFSCAKFVLDGRDSLQDALLERGVVLRSYLQRRCTSKEAWAALVRKFAALVEAKREQRKVKK